MPFATKLLNVQGTETFALRFSFYALLQVIACSAFLAMMHRMVRNHMIVSSLPQTYLTEANWGLGGMIIGFGLSIPLFFAFREAWILWIIAPLVSNVVKHRRRKRTG
jgi:hypothetical protein